MTDNEIIKALECCGNQMYSCTDKQCKAKTLGNAHYLIKRQKAEIKRLDKKADELFIQNCRLCRHNGVLQDRINELKKAKSEAIKEYREKVKQTLIEKGIFPVIVKNVMADVAKEMEESE